MSKITKLPKGLPPIPLVPRGYDRIELKGWGWSSGGKKAPYSFAEQGDKKWTSFSPERANGFEDYFYILAVKDKKKPKPKKRMGSAPKSVKQTAPESTSELKGEWIKWSERAPAAADLPIISLDDFGTIKVHFIELPGSKAWWTHLLIPCLPLTPFDHWWMLEYRPFSAKECARAAWDAGQKAAKEGK